MAVTPWCRSLRLVPRIVALQAIAYGCRCDSRCVFGRSWLRWISTARSAPSSSALRRTGPSRWATVSTIWKCSPGQLTGWPWAMRPRSCAPWPTKSVHRLPRMVRPPSWPDGSDHREAHSRLIRVRDNRWQARFAETWAAAPAILSGATATCSLMKSRLRAIRPRPAKGRRAAGTGLHYPDLLVRCGSAGRQRLTRSAACSNHSPRICTSSLP